MSARRLEAARENLSDFATIDHFPYLPFATGTFMKCYRGKYTRGPRAGEQCVAKVFKDGGAHFEASFFRHEVACAEKAIELVRRFNAARVITQSVQVNRTAVWTIIDTDERVLCEPHIKNFEKFNSNTGWKCSGKWCDVMSALSHFTYHASSGMYIVCDLQGGVYDDHVVLTDPVVLSQNQQFGPTDLGRAGIETFMARHVCTHFCDASWSRPRAPRQYYEARLGTSMALRGGAAPSGKPSFNKFCVDGYGSVLNFLLAYGLKPTPSGFAEARSIYEQLV